MIALSLCVLANSTPALADESSLRQSLEDEWAGRPVRSLAVGQFTFSFLNLAQRERYISLFFHVIAEGERSPPAGYCVRGGEVIALRDGGGCRPSARQTVCAENEVPCTIGLGDGRRCVSLDGSQTTRACLQQLRNWDRPSNLFASRLSGAAWLRYGAFVERHCIRNPSSQACSELRTYTHSLTGPGRINRFVDPPTWFEERRAWPVASAWQWWGTQPNLAELMGLVRAQAQTAQPPSPGQPQQPGGRRPGQTQLDSSTTDGQQNREEIQPNKTVKPPENEEAKCGPDQKGHQLAGGGGVVIPIASTSVLLDGPGSDIEKFNQAVQKGDPGKIREEADRIVQEKSEEIRQVRSNVLGMEEKIKGREFTFFGQGVTRKEVETHKAFLPSLAGGFDLFALMNRTYGTAPQGAGQGASNGVSRNAEAQARDAEARSNDFLRLYYGPQQYAFMNHLQQREMRINDGERGQMGEAAQQRMQLMRQHNIFNNPNARPDPNIMGREDAFADIEERSHITRRMTREATINPQAAQRLFQAVENAMKSGRADSLQRVEQLVQQSGINSPQGRDLAARLIANSRRIISKQQIAGGQVAKDLQQYARSLEATQKSNPTAKAVLFDQPGKQRGFMDHMLQGCGGGQGAGQQQGPGQTAPGPAAR